MKVYRDDGDTPGTLVTAGENPDTPLAEYRYDPPSPEGFGVAGGLSRRVRRIDKTGQSDVTYDCYYNVAWQLLEVRRGGVAYPYEQYVWSVRYVDAPVLRWRHTDTDNDVDETLYYATDANMNVAAVTDAAGAAVTWRRASWRPGPWPSGPPRPRPSCPGTARPLPRGP